MGGGTGEGRWKGVEGKWGLNTCAAKSPGTVGTTAIKLIWIFLFYFIFLASIAELDRERLRNLRGETETKIVRNSKVLVDFEVRT